MIEAIFAYPCGNLSANASGQRVFMKYKYAIGFLYRLFNAFFIPRKQCAQVKQISFYLFHFTENLLCPMHTHSVSDDGEIVSFAQQLCLSDFNGVVIIRNK